jgi:hypothetical protein
MPDTCYHRNLLTQRGGRPEQPAHAFADDGAHFMLSLIRKQGWAASLILFLTLHQPDGQEVYVSVDQIGYIGPAVPRLHPGAGSRLLVYGAEITVRETPDEVVGLLGPDYFKRGGAK